jgi:recombination protein RecA
MIDLGVQQNIIEKSGSWFSYKTERIGQGRENARQFLKDNPDIRENVDRELRKSLGLIKDPVNGAASLAGANGSAPSASPVPPTSGPRPAPPVAPRGR